MKNGGAIFEIKASHQFEVVDGETSTGGGLQGVGKLFECLFPISSPICPLLFELDDIEAKKEVSSHEVSVYAAVGRKQELLVGLPAKVNELVEVHEIWCSGRNGLLILNFGQEDRICRMNGILNVRFLIMDCGGATVAGGVNFGF